jgi:hypothetical protein
VIPLLAHAHFGGFSPLGWALVGLAALIGAWSIWLAVRYTVRPGEDDPNHVKRSILDGSVLDDHVVVTVRAAARPVPPSAGPQAPEPLDGR